jgi:hypothetical protein
MESLEYHWNAILSTFKMTFSSFRISVHLVSLVMSLPLQHSANHGGVHPQESAGETAVDGSQLRIILPGHLAPKICDVKMWC